ncbi:hypothetical protein PGQ11_009647 [Apiospora arundinis]|uniref:Uncharacterized protein n=1 Tax=Apiospora arundinis TaxID=335852 RepID=A0ABR2IJK9_9PEZI
MPLALTACHWQESNCGCPHLCHNINCRTSAFQHSDVKCSAVCNTGITGITTFWTVLGYILAAYGGLNLLWKATNKGARLHKWAQGHGQRLAGYELDHYVVDRRRRPINESEEDGSHKPETPAAPAEPAEPAEPESLAPERDQYQ